MDDAEIAEIVNELPIKYQAIGILQEEGLAKKDIARALNITRQRVSQVQVNLSKNGLTGNIKRLKTALKAHDKILKTFNDAPTFDDLPKNLKVSDVNTCIDRSLDRNEPKTTRQENLNLNINLSPVDLAEFKRK